MVEFFKVFLPDFSSSELVIPPAFIDILEKPLPREASLIDEIGRLWCVEIETEDTDERFRVFLKKGWDRFAIDHSLNFGDFLVFNYDGDSKFSVAIFANDGCKKDLSDQLRVPVKEQPRVNVTKPKRGRPSRVKVETNGVSASAINIPVNDKPVEEIEPQHKKRKRTTDHYGINSKKTGEPVSKPESQQSVPVYKPKHPHFVRTITHSALHRMEIPMTVLKSNGIIVGEDVEICDENGTKWAMKSLVSKRGMRLSKDWSGFANFHELKRDDKCVLEFIVKGNGRCNEIQIRIFRDGLETVVSKLGYQVIAI